MDDEAREVLRKGPAAWNAWRKAQGNDSFDAKVNGVLRLCADLPGRDLQGIDLSNVRLHEGTFSGANLRGAIFHNATIEYVNFSDADLSHASFNNSHIYWSTFHGAALQHIELYNCSLEATNLDRANMSSALVAKTSWCDLDLSGVQGLDTIEHRGPSSIGIDTIYGSGGRIPDAFLRGAGVPDNLIDLQKTLVQGVTPIQFYSCFISYNHEDEEFAKRLHSRLQQAGLRVWFAPEEMKGGRKLLDQIDEAIRMHDKLLLVLSRASMASEWVATEVSKARRRERREGKQVLFPIRLVDFEAIENWTCFDADIGKDSAREVREYFVPDFTDWKNHDKFEAVVVRLLKDLQASAS